MYFGIFCCCLLIEVLTPPPYQQITPTERQEVSDEAHSVLAGHVSVCRVDAVYVLAHAYVHQILCVFL